MPRVLTVDTLLARGWPPHAARHDLACGPDLAHLFHQDHGGHPVEYERARAICLRCPAVAACLEWALDTRQAHGMWGATTPQERAAILRDGLRQAVLAHLLARPE